MDMTLSAWGGLVETLEKCQEPNKVPENIKTLRKKLKVLEESKSLDDIQHSLHFTREERNYLNSPLLDEIFETIFTEFPIRKALKEKKNKAVKFYHTRCKTSSERIMSLAIEYNNLEIIEYLLSIEPPTKGWDFNTLLQSAQNRPGTSSEIIEFFIGKGGRISLENLGYGILDSVSVKIILTLKLEPPLEIIKRWDLSEYHYSNIISQGINTLFEHVDICENNYQLMKEILKTNLYYFKPCFEKYNFRETDPVIMHLRDTHSNWNFGAYVYPYLAKK